MAFTSHIKYRIKKGDVVIVRRGRDRGKRGKVLRMYPKEGLATVEGIHLVKKHLKPRRVGQKGEVVIVPRPIRVSHIQLFCEQCSRGVRVGVQKTTEGNYVRICKRCKSVI